MKIPFISTSLANRILCFIVGVVFISHGSIRIYDGTVSQLGELLQGRGFPIGAAWAWGLTLNEMISGAFLALGRKTRILSILFIIQLITGIILFHIHNGWFVVGHSTGGIEYSLVLIAALLNIAAQKA